MLPAPLAAASRNRTHLACLDYFRGVAILGVVACHAIGPRLSYFATHVHQAFLHFVLLLAGRFFDLGGLGVAIFFVVSGFCIHLSHLRSRESGFFTFYIRRVFRIYPAYLVSLFLFLAILPPVNFRENGTAPVSSQIDLALHLLLAQNLLPQTLSSINPAYWSLAIEFQLYLLFPALLYISNRIGWREALIVMAAGEIASRLASITGRFWMEDLYQPWRWMSISPLGFWFSWSIGAIIAEAWVKKQPLPFRAGPLPLWLWPFIIACSASIPYLADFCFPITALATGRFLVFFLSHDPEATDIGAPNIGLRILSFFGAISYSLYLLHQPLFAMNLFPWLDPQGKSFSEVAHILSQIMAFPAIVALSWILYRLVEIPGISAGKNLLRRIQ